MLVWLGPSMRFDLLRTRRLPLQIVRARDPAAVVGVLHQRAEDAAARRRDRAQLLDAGARRSCSRACSWGADDAGAHRVRRRRASSGMLLIVQPGQRDLPGRVAARAAGRVLLRRLPDHDADAGGRESARAAVLSGADRHARDDDSPLPFFDWPAEHAAGRTSRSSCVGGLLGTLGPLPVHPGVPARAGLGADAVHVHAARLGDADRLARVRRVPDGVSRGRHGAHRRQRAC